MNKEIKEILDRLDYNEWDIDLYKVPITWCELYDIRDYIINLQQKIEKFNDDKRGMLVQLYKANDERDKLQQENERLSDKVEFYEDVDSDRCAYNEELQKENKRLKEEKDNLYLDNTMLKMEKDIYKQGYEDLKDLLNTLQNGSEK